MRTALVDLPLKMARNGIVHDDGAKVARVQAGGGRSPCGRWTSGSRHWTGVPAAWTSSWAGSLNLCTGQRPGEGGGMSTLPAIGVHVHVPWGAGSAEGDVVMPTTRDSADRLSSLSS
jgi:hypothetical protein